MWGDECRGGINIGGEEKKGGDLKDPPAAEAMLVSIIR